MELPAIFTEETQALLGDAFPAFQKALSEENPVSIRLNPSKPIKINDLERIPWCENGYYLKSRPLFTADPLFHAGCYYVQEASSMFVEQIIKHYIHNPSVCLDLCAAPGGKSTHFSTSLPKDSLLISNEVIRSRAFILAENLTKWGNLSTVITNNDPSEIGQLKNLFDLILADVPCSGEGMFRKDPKAREEWSPANVRLCAERQRRIIADIWPSLKPGGILVYSTCTFNTKENEENIVWIAETFGAEPLSPEFPSDWKITGSKRGNLPVFRFWPHLTKGEGFFIAALRKSPEDEISAYNKQKKNKTGNKQTINVIPNEVKNWLKDSSTCDFRLKGNQISAIPEIYKSIIQTLEENLKIISCGIPLAEVKGKDLIPQHTMAMCTAVNQNAFPVYEMEREAALQYLSRETISLPPDFPKGYILLTYNKHPLGFVKNIGNRTNNLYPQEWRIRMNVKDID